MKINKECVLGYISGVSFTILVSCLLLVFLGLDINNSWMKIKRQEMKNEAISQCLNVGSFSTEIDNSKDTDSKKTISKDPIKYWYEFCMQEKGY